MSEEKKKSSVEIVEGIPEFGENFGLIMIPRTARLPEVRKYRLQAAALRTTCTGPIGRGEGVLPARRMRSPRRTVAL